MNDIIALRNPNSRSNICTDCSILDWLELVDKEYLY
jgi:hypothetical protein